MGKRGTKDAARQAWQAEQEAQKKRERVVRIGMGAGIAALVLAIVGVAILARGQDSNVSTGTGINPAAALPQGVQGPNDTYQYAVAYPVSSSASNVVEIWEDPQCPACAALKNAVGARLTQLAEQGQVQIMWRPAAFLDRSNDSGANPQSSTRAISAWGCAIDAGKTREYHDALYASQPVREGEGWSDEQLIDLGAQSGLSGAALEEFATCVEAGTYLGWAGNSAATFVDKAISGTPYVLLNGEEIPTATLADEQAFQELLGGQGN